MYHMTVKNNQVDEGRLDIEVIKLNLGPGQSHAGVWGVDFYMRGMQSFEGSASAQYRQSSTCVSAWSSVNWEVHFSAQTVVYFKKKKANSSTYKLPSSYDTRLLHIFNLIFTTSL